MCWPWWWDKTYGRNEDAGKGGDIYKVYGERQGLFTQDDIDYLRPFQQSLSILQNCRQG